MKSLRVLSVVVILCCVAQARAEDWLNVRDLGASGSAFETTAQTAAGSNRITLANVGDFKVGQGVTVSRCNIRYTAIQMWGTGQPYYNAKAAGKSVEVRGYDGSAGSWLVFVLDSYGSQTLIFRNNLIERGGVTDVKQAMAVAGKFELSDNRVVGFDEKQDRSTAKP